MSKTLHPTELENCFLCQSLYPDKLPVWNGNKIVREEENNLGGATCSNKESEHYDFHFIFKEDSKELLCSCFNKNLMQ